MRGPLFLLGLLAGNCGCAAPIAADTAPLIIARLQVRQYTDAIVLVRNAPVTVAERDFMLQKGILRLHTHGWYAIVLW